MLEKLKILFHFNSSISASLYSSVQNTGTDKVGKRVCEATRRGARQALLGVFYPSYGRGTASSCPVPAAEHFALTAVYSGVPAACPRLDP